MLLVLYKRYEFFTVISPFVYIVQCEQTQGSQCLLVVDIIDKAETKVTYKVLFKSKIKEFTLHDHLKHLVYIYD